MIFRFVGFYLNKEVGIRNHVTWWCTDKPSFTIPNGGEDSFLWMASNDFDCAFFPRREFDSFHKRCTYSYRY